MSRRANNEGTFYRRPDGLYQYRVQIDGHRITTYGRTQAAAKAKAKEKARNLGDVRTTATVADLVREWTELAVSATGLRPTTRDQYTSLLRTHVVPAIGPTRLDALTKRSVALTVGKFDGASSTRRSAYAALVKVLDYAVTQGLLGRNVAREVSRPQRAESSERAISTEGALAVLKAAKGHRWEVAAWLSFGCGLRRGEALGLRWSDIDLERGVASITGSVTRSSAGLVRGATKTRRGLRQVPLPTPVVDALKAHRLRQNRDKLKAGPAWASTDHVITNEAGALVEPRALSKAWRGWARKAKVSDTGTHLGRHYAATTLLGSGRASVADVAAQLGHDPSVLLATYASAVADGQRAAADVLGASLSAPVSAPVASGHD